MLTFGVRIFEYVKKYVKKNIEKSKTIFKIYLLIFVRLIEHENISIKYVININIFIHVTNDNHFIIFTSTNDSCNSVY